MTATTCTLPLCHGTIAPCDCLGYRPPMFNAAITEEDIMSTKDLFCVVYRVGGTENFQWRRSLAMSRAEAEKAREETARMGYKTLLVNYHQSVTIGLPETYGAD